ELMDPRGRARQELSRLLPWWGKLVHQMLLAEASGESEVHDERWDHTDPPGARLAHLHPPIDERAGSTSTSSRKTGSTRSRNARRGGAGRHPGCTWSTRIGARGARPPRGALASRGSRTP